MRGHWWSILIVVILIISATALGISIWQWHQVNREIGQEQTQCKAKWDNAKWVILEYNPEDDYGFIEWRTSLEPQEKPWIGNRTQLVLQDRYGKTKDGYFFCLDGKESFDLENPYMIGWTYIIYQKDSNIPPQLYRVK